MSAPGQRGIRVQRVNGLPEAYSGVTTVWLLSTLGGSRNINTIGIKKKDILSISIPKTCESLLMNKSEYTLKSASSLLYGVTVCYSRKTDYVLADVNSIKTQLYRQLFQTARKSVLLPITSANQNNTIFDGVHEYRNLREFQEMQSAEARGTGKERRFNNALLADDPNFDINQVRDYSFLFGDKHQRDSSASLIHKRDMLEELQNGYSYETGPNVGPLEARYSHNRDYLNHSEFSSLDADLNLDFDDVLSETEMGSTKARSVNSPDPSDQENFDLLFDREPAGLTDFEELPDLDMLPSGQENNERSNGNLSLLQQQQSDLHPNKKRKISHGNPDLIRLKIDECTGLGNGALRENNDKYLSIMESMARPMKLVSYPTQWKSTLLKDDGPDFLRLCYVKLLWATDADASSLEHGTSSVDEIERGRQKMRSLPPSRSNSSVASAERGRKMGPAILQRSGSEENMQSIDLPDLQEINENGEHINEEEAFDEVEEDFMRIDLQLPPSSFGRSSSRTEAGSRDQIEELRRMHSERGAHRNGTLQSVEDIDESSEQPESADTGLRAHTQNQVLDNQSRRFFDYIFERASFAGKTTRSHPPFAKKLLFEDIIPSKLGTEESITDESNSLPSVTRKMAANAFLSLLQLASKSYVDIDPFEPMTPFSSLTGSDILVCI
ncbi:LAFA_0C07976g1_1 [Lachancea sp. 'fantastica']|nr:LAFA_0C07976g1_1 [Lachancea sp. 'fantastica']